MRGKMVPTVNRAGSRPLAYRIGQLLAIGEILEDDEHNPGLMRIAFSTPWQIIPRFQARVNLGNKTDARRWDCRKRWETILTEMPDIPKQALDVMGETQCALGYWHERTNINRAWKLLRMRQKMDMTQTDWAQVLGVSVKTVQAWEQHANNVPEEIEKLAELVKERAIN